MSRTQTITVRNGPSASQINGNNSTKKQSKTVSKKKKRNQKKKAAQRQASNRQMNIARYQAERFYLSPCSRDYLRALVDPFTLEGGRACIPDASDLPSWKTLIISRGTMNVGTGGFGFTLVNPSNLANDTKFVLATDSTYPLFTFPLTNVSAGVLIGTSGQAPYNDASYTAVGVLGRVVGCGLRVRYTGTELNRSGRLIPYRSNNIGIANVASTSVSDLLSQPQIPSIACDREWHSVTYLPTASIFSSNYSNKVSVPAASTTMVGFDLGFAVSGAVPGNGFEWEVYQHLEIITGDGTLVPSGTSRSHSDLPGVSAIRNSLESNLPVGDADSSWQQAMKYISTYSMDEISHVVDSSVKTARLLGYL